MRKTILAVFTLLVTTAATLVTPVTAVEVKSKAKEITLTGRMQSQFNTSSVEGELGSEFLIRRARITVEVELNDFVEGKVQPDYGEGKFTLKDAFMKLNYSPDLSFRIGQFKRPFDLFELTSSTKILVVERALRIRGVSGHRSYSSLTEKLGFADRDIGVEVAFKSKDKKLGITAAVTNASGANAVPSKTDGALGEMQYTGRVLLKPVEDQDLAFGFGASLRPYETDSVTVEYAPAVEGDIELGNFDEGAHIQAGFLWGENWTVSVPDTASPPKFMSVQVIGGYRIPVADSKYVEAVEPILRVSFADPNGDMDDDGGILVTPGIQFFFTGRNKIAVNVDVFMPQSDAEDTEYSLKAQSSVHF